MNLYCNDCHATKDFNQTEDERWECPACGHSVLILTTEQARKLFNALEDLGGYNE